MGGIIIRSKVAFASLARLGRRESVHWYTDTDGGGNLGNPALFRAPKGQLSRQDVQQLMRCPPNCVLSGKLYRERIGSVEAEIERINRAVSNSMYILNSIDITTERIFESVITRSIEVLPAYHHMDNYGRNAGFPEVLRLCNADR